MSPCLHRSAVSLQQKFSKLLPSLWVLLSCQDRRRAPLFQELDIVFFQDVVAIQIETFEELRGPLRKGKLQAPQRGFELVPADLARAIHVEEVESQGDAAEPLIQAVLEMSQHLGTLWIQFINAGEATLVLIQDFPELFGLLRIAHSNARLQEARLGQDHRLGQRDPPGAHQVAVAVSLSQMLLEVDKLPFQSFPGHTRHLLLGRVLLGHALLADPFQLNAQPAEAVRLDEAVAIKVQGVEEHILVALLPIQPLQSISEMLA
mmetsp:Transcript_46483/g.101133  ORF Transcript_46483/g.101133 Transcript_46483/m.101133 type:complete len:262 (-) Transcript_46483:151-936(-)